MTYNLLDFFIKIFESRQLPLNSLHFTFVRRRYTYGFGQFALRLLVQLPEHLQTFLVPDIVFARNLQLFGHHDLFVLIVTVHTSAQRRAFYVVIEALAVLHQTFALRTIAPF